MSMPGGSAGQGEALPFVAGLVKTSLVDYPGRLCTTLFFGGCNFRCPYCHNRALVLGDGVASPLSGEETIGCLARRRHLVDAACISGGEPTLVRSLPLLAARLKELGLKVKLDTNGTRPAVIRELLQAGTVDYVALDIKAPLPKYELVARTNVNLDDIRATVALLRQGGVEYEFRTTVVPGLLTREDLLAIGDWLAGAPTYVLQQFRPRSTLDKAYEHVKPYPDEWLVAAAEALRPAFGQVKVRGLSQAGIRSRRAW